MSLHVPTSLPGVRPGRRSAGGGGAQRGAQHRVRERVGAAAAQGLRESRGSRQQLPLGGGKKGILGDLGGFWWILDGTSGETGFFG